MSTSDSPRRTRLNRELNLERARHYANNGWNKAKVYPLAGIKLPDAA